MKPELDSQANISSTSQRVMAILVDTFITSSVNLILIYSLGSITKPMLILVLLFNNIFGGVYFVFFHFRFGQTLGKMLLKLEVKTIALKKISFKQAFLRSSIDLLLAMTFFILELLFIINIPADLISKGKVSNITNFLYEDNTLIFLFLALPWYSAELLTLLLTSKKRAVHDFIASTVVIARKSLTKGRTILYALLNIVLIIGLIGIITSIQISTESDEKYNISYFKENKDEITNKDFVGKTPLHHACKENNIELVEFLLSKKVNVNQKDIKGNTPLHEALSSEADIKLIRLLLKNGANVDLKNNSNETLEDVISFLYQDSEKSEIINLLEQSKVHRKKK